MSDLDDKLRAHCCRWSEVEREFDCVSYPCLVMQQLRGAARIGAEAEREACAKLADSFAEVDDKPWEVVDAIVVAIRARGAK